MQEPTDDQLDGLFRKSAEELNAPFDPAAWQALKTRLDTHDRLTPWEHLLRWGLPMLLLLFLVGGSWNAYRQRTMAGQTPATGVAIRQPASGNDNPVPNRPAQQQSQRVDNGKDPSSETAASLSKVDDPAETAIAKPNDSKQPALIAKSGEKIDKPAEAGVSSVTGERSGPTAAGAAKAETRSDKTTTLAGPAYRVRPVRSSSATASVVTVSPPERTRMGADQQGRSRRLSGRVTKNRFATTFPATDNATEPLRSFNKRQTKPDATAGKSVNKLRPDSGLLPGADAISAHRFSVGPSDRNGSLPAAKTAASGVSPLFVELNNRPAQWPKALSFTGREVTAPINRVEAEQPVSVLSVPSQKGLSVRFVVSPDLSAIGLRNFQRPGTNVGLLLDYRLASRWSVQAGVMRSTKVYKALTSQYELPSYVANLRVPPESVNGRCNMLDIPINLRYDVVLRPRLNGQIPSRWFLSGGVTTYIMQQEDYAYNYPVGTHIYPTTPKGWHGNSGRYNFSQLNLSAGYERALSRRLSWQVEPFVKAPLKGVGYYKINLLSTGAFFSLRYKL